MTTRTRSVRDRSLVLAAGALLLLPGAALAHSELMESSPEAGAELETPPTEVVLTFDGELRPDGSGFTVIGPDGSEAGAGELDLRIAKRDRLHGPVDAAEPGEYRVAWTAVALDGHADEGSFTFVVIGDTDLVAPDTALPTPAGGSPLAVIGALLLAGALRAARIRVGHR